MISAETVKLDPILVKLIELGVNEQWLIKTKITPVMAWNLLKGILYLEEMDVGRRRE
jgi:hypothetical protein